MIQEFVNYSTSIKERACDIGRIAQRVPYWRLLTGKTVVHLIPFPLAINYGGVIIALGTDFQGTNIPLEVPTAIFEGSLEQTEKWIQEENQIHLESTEEFKLYQEQKKREEEIAILRELMQKYPREWEV